MDRHKRNEDDDRKYDPPWRKDTFDGKNYEERNNTENYPSPNPDRPAAPLF